MEIEEEVVSIRRLPEDELNVREVRISCPDATGLGVDLSRVLLDFGLRILRGDISTDGKWCFLIFRVQLSSGVPPRWQLLKSRLEIMCPNGMDSLSALYKWRSLPKEHPPFLLQVASYDRAGMLHSLSHVLWEADTTVFKAHITTSPSGEVSDMFWIYDNRNELPERHRVLEICDRIKAVLGPEAECRVVAAPPDSMAQGALPRGGAFKACKDAASYANLRSIVSRRKERESRGLAGSLTAYGSLGGASSLGGSVAGSLGVVGSLGVAGSLGATRGNSLAAGSLGNIAESPDLNAGTSQNDSPTEPGSMGATLGAMSGLGSVGALAASQEEEEEDGRARVRGGGGTVSRPRSVPSPSKPRGGGDEGQARRQGQGPSNGPQVSNGQGQQGQGSQQLGHRQGNGQSNPHLSNQGNGRPSAATLAPAASTASLVSEAAWSASRADAGTSTFGDPAGSGLRAPAGDVDIQVDNETSPSYTLLTLQCHDRKGLLYDVFLALKEISVRVAYGRVVVDQSRDTCECDLFVQDAEAARIADAELLDELLARVRLAVTLPVRIEIRDAFQGTATELLIAAPVDSGGRGRPRVTFDVTQGLAIAGVGVFMADVYVDRGLDDAADVEMHRFLIHLPNGQPIRSDRDKKAVYDVVRAQLMGTLLEGSGPLQGGVGGGGGAGAVVGQAPRVGGGSGMGLAGTLGTPRAAHAAFVSAGSMPLGVATPEGHEAAGLLRSLSDRWKFGG